MKTKLNGGVLSHVAVLLCAGQLHVNAYVNPPGPPTNSSALLDQSQALWGSTAVVGSFSAIQLAQTFTPSISGFLERVDITAGENRPMEADGLSISIYTTQNGVPNISLGSINLTTINPDPLVVDWYVVDLSSLSISLTAGQTYAMVISDFGFSGVTLEGTPGDSYAGGRTLTEVGNNVWEPYGAAQDLAFQTWVTPIPEPCPMALLFLGFIFLVRGRK